MVEQPLVSIVCTVYNKETWLVDTIKSFLAQKTDFPFEILLIDDASTDGSSIILQKYADSYPDSIRLFSNETNLGIAKTWKKICLEARGHYIARCDGDDIWIDSEKLQKQVQALKENPSYKWCSTDIAYIDQKGQEIEKAVFRNKELPFVDSYEQMLVTRGFTAPSTWLVEKDLMLEVNQELDVTTADDTFDMQLDLFQRTDKLYLDIVTVAYRVHEGSDSRPKDFSRLCRRFDRLLQTQLSYLDKYPKADYKKMTQILLDQNNTYEIQLSKPVDSLSHIGIENLTVYFGDENGLFNEKDIFRKLIQKSDEVRLVLPQNVKRIRIDLSEIPSFYSHVQLLDSHNQPISPLSSSGFVYSDFYLFPNKDPQLIYELGEGVGSELTLKYTMMDIDDVYAKDYVGRVLAQSIDHLQKELSQVQKDYQAVLNSRRWRLATKLVNLFRKRK